MIAQRRLDARDALADTLLALAKDREVTVDPERLMDLAHAITHGTCEDLEATIDFLIGVLRHDDHLRGVTL